MPEIMLYPNQFHWLVTMRATLSSLFWLGV
jgi:hypothetical protein